jgi:hypothetical protein
MSMINIWIFAGRLPHFQKFCPILTNLKIDWTEEKDYIVIVKDTLVTTLLTENVIDLLKALDSVIEITERMGKVERLYSLSPRDKIEI